MNKKIIFGSACISLLVVGAVSMLMVLTQVTQPIVENVVEKERKWSIVAGPSPANFAGGSTTGIVGIYIREHWANGSYSSNITNYKDPYAYEGTQYNKSLGGNVPASTAFDIIITVRVTDSDIFNGTTPQIAAGSIPLAGDWARMNLTCPHTTPAIGALTAASGRRNITDQVIGGGNDMFYNFWWNQSAGGGAAGAGYTIGNGVHANVTAFTLEIYS